MYCDQVSYVSLYVYRRHERESFRKYIDFRPTRVLVLTELQ
jgi:hypothetical protein